MVMACVMAFDFRDKKAGDLFNQWVGWAHKNTFGGSWTNHRHDQSVISVLAAQLHKRLIHPMGIIGYKNDQDHIREGLTKSPIFYSGR